METKTNAENLWQYKNKFSFIVVHILAFASSTNLVGEVKNMFLNFKQVVFQSFLLLNLLIEIGRSILSLNFKQFANHCTKIASA